eukprot:5588698-Amphidinium_carterae.1
MAPVWADSVDGTDNFLVVRGWQLCRNRRRDNIINGHTLIHCIVNWNMGIARSYPSTPVMGEVTIRSSKQHSSGMSPCSGRAEDSSSTT